MSESDNIDL
jgi:DNA-directed RNA polymerase I subunit RPA2